MDDVSRLPVGVMLSAMPPAARFVVQGRTAEMWERLAGVAGGGVPGMGRAAAAGGRAVLGLGPFEALVLDEDVESGVGAALGSALDGVACSVVDVSSRQTGIEVVGRLAGDLLAHGCPLDLGIAAFPVGACTRTVLAACGMTLWRVGEERFRVEVMRSFSEYAWGFLRFAQRDMGV